MRWARAMRATSSSHTFASSASGESGAGCACDRLGRSGLEGGPGAQVSLEISNTVPSVRWYSGPGQAPGVAVYAADWGSDSVGLLRRLVRFRVFADGVSDASDPFRTALPSTKSCKDRSVTKMRLPIETFSTWPRAINESSVGNDTPNFLAASSRLCIMLFNLPSLTLTATGEEASLVRVSMKMPVRWRPGIEGQSMGWVQRYLEGKLREAPDAALLAQTEGYAERNGLEDDRVGREAVLEVAKMMISYRSGSGRPLAEAPGSAPRTGQRARAIRLLTEEDQARSRVTSDAVAAMAEAIRAGVASGPPPVPRNDRSDVEMVSEVSRFIASLSALDQSLLSRFAQLLARDTGWPESATQWFTLTGEPPIVDPVGISGAKELGTPNATLTLEIQLSVSPKSVATIYADFQRKILGREHRSISLMALDRSAFARERRMKGEKWESIFERWKPRWKKRWKERSKGGAGTWKRFQRDYARTMRMLLRPQIAPAFRAEVASRAAELAQLRRRLAAEANVGPLVALAHGVRPQEYEAARRRLEARTGTARPRKRPATRRRTARAASERARRT
jgi:hypothetical protein